MTDETEEQQVTLEQSTPENETTDSPAESTSCKRKCYAKIIIFILLLFIIAGLAYGGYYLFKLQKDLQEGQGEIRKLQVGLAYSQDQQVQQQKYLELQNEQISSVKQHLGFNQSKWQLAESQYLLKLANFNLQYQENSQVALQLVTTAENILKKVQLSELQPIRNQLSDITYQLQSIQSEDLAVILARLNTLQTQATKLELPVPKFSETQSAQNNSDTSQSKEDWREHFQSTLSELKDMVVVRYHEKPISEQQLPRNRGYLREQLAMLLTQAEWAVMRNEQHLYQNAITQALEWTQQYFDTTKANVQTFAEALQQLQKTSVTASRYPNLSPVIDDLNSMLQRRENTETTSEKASTDESEDAA